MGNDIIIDNQSLVAWHRRIFSNVSTTAMWIFWFSLWRPVLHFGLKKISLLALLSAGLIVDDKEYAIPLLALATALPLWNWIAKSTAEPVTVDNIDYAKHFDFTPEDMLHYQNSKVTVVHHNEHGRIINIEVK